MSNSGSTQFLQNTAAAAVAAAAAAAAAAAEDLRFGGCGETFDRFRTFLVVSDVFDRFKVFLAVFGRFGTFWGQNCRNCVELGLHCGSIHRQLEALWKAGDLRTW